MVVLVQTIFMFGEIDCREGLTMAVDKLKYDTLEAAMDVLLDIYMGKKTGRRRIALLVYLCIAPCHTCLFCTLMTVHAPISSRILSGAYAAVSKSAQGNRVMQVCCWSLYSREGLRSLCTQCHQS